MLSRLRGLLLGSLLLSGTRVTRPLVLLLLLLLLLRGRRRVSLQRDFLPVGVGVEGGADGGGKLDDGVGDGGLEDLGGELYWLD